MISLLSIRRTVTPHQSRVEAALPLEAWVGGILSKSSCLGQGLRFMFTSSLGPLHLANNSQAPMTSHADDDASTASADPPPNDNVDITRSPAVIHWLDDNGQPQSLSHSPLTHDHATLDVKFDNENCTALFKATINISLKGKRNKSNVFLFIYPEHIQNLALVNNGEDVRISAADKLGTTTHVLNFALSTPATLVVPGDSCVPKNESTRSTLLLLQDLAGRYNFNVAFPTRILSKDRLTVVCDEVSSSQGRVKTMPGFANMAKLYGGKGGRVMRPGDRLESDFNIMAETASHDLEAAAHVSDAIHLEREDLKNRKLDTTQQDQGEGVESPPSYDELDGDRSLPGYSRPGNKRRRLGSDVGHTAGKESLRLEEICRRGFSDIGGRLDRIEQSLGTLGSRLDRAEERMLAIECQLDQSRSSEQKDRQPSDLASRVDLVEGRVDDVEQRLDVGLSELATDIENQIYDVRHEFDNMISVRVGDEMGVAQSELEDFVKDEMHGFTEDIEQAVRERLRDALA